MAYDTVVILSGGLDSTVLLYYMMSIGAKPRVLSFNYGQRHRRELEHATEICATAGVPQEIVDIHEIGKLLRSSQTSKLIEVPEGHYSHESMKVTVVPNRNMIMLSIAAGFALSTGCDLVAFAAHAGDHTIYPDCRLEFVDSLNQTLALCDWNKVKVMSPFISRTKAEIVQLGHEMGVPLQLTYSCYKGGDKHCGRCGTDVERREAFKLAGVPDPTEYEDKEDPVISE